MGGINMMAQMLGRFGRLRKTLSEEKNKIKTPISQETLAFKNNEEEAAAPSATSEDFEQMTLVFAWLSICLSEGHIEPSQPSVGRIIGWPVRPFFKSSLYVDFECWCSKNRTRRVMDMRKLFYSLTDKIFICDGDKYHFPSLEKCRNEFKPLAEEFYVKG